MITITPTIARVRERFRHISLREVADKSWVIHPAVNAVAPAAIYNDADLDRVTGVDPIVTREIEWRRIQGGLVEHAATIAYRVRNALLSGGHVFLPRLVHRVSNTPVPLWGHYTEIETAPTLLAATRNGSRYFGHWIMDDLTLSIASPDIGQAIVPPRTLSEHQIEYLKLLEMEKSQTVRTDAMFSQLTILEDFGQNDYKLQRYQTMRSRLRKGREGNTHPGVMLMRKQSGVSRLLTNEEELAEVLKQRGFRCLCPTEHSVDEVLNACAGAETIIGVEGSQMIHGLMGAPDSCTLIVLQPPDRFNNVLKGFCDCLGVRYAFTVGYPHHSGFYVDSQSLLRLMDRLSA